MVFFVQTSSSVYFYSLYTSVTILGELHTVRHCFVSKFRRRGVGHDFREFDSPDEQVEGAVEFVSDDDLE